MGAVGALLAALLVVHAAGQSEMDAAVATGVADLRAKAEKSLVLVTALMDAINSGDLDAAKAAYIVSRPYYEQIEVLANSFGETDSDIDARAYSFVHGEAIEGREVLDEPGAFFKGFHRIEGLLFRNGNVTSAARWGEILVASSEQLVTDLSDTEAFSPALSFQGMIGLSTEVGAKKMSSEEETYSDMSVLIFHNNFLGVMSQYEPFSPLVAAADSEADAAVNAALSDAFATVEPFITVDGDKTTYAPYSTLTIEDRASIQSAAYAIADALVLARDALGVPDADEGEEEEVCDPTDEFDMTSAPIMAGLDYFRALIPFEKTLVSELRAAVEGGDVEAAKAAYQKARPLYEQIEVLATSFGDEDSDIDARPYSFKFGEFDEEFRGFHKLERQIYRDGNLDEAAVATAVGLEDSVAALEVALTETSDPKRYTGKSVFEGVIGLATEIMSRKISSEEELFTGLSYLIFYNNWKGIYSQAAPFLAEASEDMKNRLDTAIQEAVACMPVSVDDDVLDVSADSVDQTFVDNLTGGDYGNYAEATLETRECIVEKGYAVRAAVTALAHEIDLFPECSAFHQNSFYPYRHHS